MRFEYLQLLLLLITTYLVVIIPVVAESATSLLPGGLPPGVSANERKQIEAAASEAWKQVVLKWRQKNRDKVNAKKRKEALDVVHFARLLVEKREKDQAQSRSEKDEVDRIAILIRSHNPTPSALSRIIRWAKSIKGHSRYQMHISMDVTNGMEAYQTTYRALRPFDVVFHRYNNGNISDAYPILEGIVPRIPPFVLTHGFGSGYAKGFHLEALSVWWTYIQSKLRLQYSYVWVMEDDVGLTGGSLLDLISSYDQPPTITVSAGLGSKRPPHQADLITWGEYQTAHNAKETIDQRWIFHDTVTELYAAWVPELSQVYTQVKEGRRQEEPFAEAVHSVFML
jgi:hypothetical protein